MLARSHRVTLRRTTRLVSLIVTPCPLMSAQRALLASEKPCKPTSGHLRNCSTQLNYLASTTTSHPSSKLSRPSLTRMTRSSPLTTSLRSSRRSRPCASTPEPSTTSTLVALLLRLPRRVSPLHWVPVRTARPPDTKAQTATSIARPIFHLPFSVHHQQRKSGIRSADWDHAPSAETAINMACHQNLFPSHHHQSKTEVGDLIPLLPEDDKHALKSADPVQGSALLTMLAQVHCRVNAGPTPDSILVRPQESQDARKRIVGRGTGFCTSANPPCGTYLSAFCLA